MEKVWDLLKNVKFPTRKLDTVTRIGQVTVDITCTSRTTALELVDLLQKKTGVQAMLYHTAQTWVKVGRVPSPLENQDIMEVLQQFAKPHSTKVDYQRYKNGVKTGVRAYQLNTTDLQSHQIPSYIRVKGCLLWVSYPGQPKTCRGCGEVRHLFSECPKRSRAPEGALPAVVSASKKTVGEAQDNGHATPTGKMAPARAAPTTTKPSSPKQRADEEMEAATTIDQQPPTEVAEDHHLQADATRTATEESESDEPTSEPSEDEEDENRSQDLTSSEETGEEPEEEIAGVPSLVNENAAQGQEDPNEEALQEKKKERTSCNEPGQTPVRKDCLEKSVSCKKRPRSTTPTALHLPLKASREDGYMCSFCKTKTVFPDSQTPGTDTACTECGRKYFLGRMCCKEGLHLYQGSTANAGLSGSWIRCGACNRRKHLMPCCMTVVEQLKFDSSDFTICSACGASSKKCKDECWGINVVPSEPNRPKRCVSTKCDRIIVRCSCGGFHRPLANLPYTCKGCRTIVTTKVERRGSYHSNYTPRLLGAKGSLAS
ncbi:uncharacterized protein LOC144750140 [Ciona intestinalis]